MITSMDAERPANKTKCPFFKKKSPLQLSLEGMCFHKMKGICSKLILKEQLKAFPPRSETRERGVFGPFITLEVLATALRPGRESKGI